MGGQTREGTVMVRGDSLNAPWGGQIVRTMVATVIAVKGTWKRNFRLVYSDG